MNPRLGIVGGLSILGTTGIVSPFPARRVSRRSIGASMSRAPPGYTHIAARNRGNQRDASVQRALRDARYALVEMGDFAGGTLKYLRTHPIERVTIAGGFAKLAKLAAGHLDLHSRRSRVDIVALADRLAAVRSRCSSRCRQRGKPRVLARCWR